LSVNSNQKIEIMEKNFFTGFVITKKFTCPACGAVLFGYEALCSGCEINLCTYTCSTTAYNGFFIKYFYKPAPRTFAARTESPSLTDASTSAYEKKLRDL